MKSISVGTFATIIAVIILSVSGGTAYLIHNFVSIETQQTLGAWASGILLLAFLVYVIRAFVLLTIHRVSGR